MTRIELLEALTDFTRKSLRGLMLPVQPTEEDEEPEPRECGVYWPGLPEVRQYARYAPFVTHEVVTGRDGLDTVRPGVRMPLSQAVVRSCVCVYCADSLQGRQALLEVMERLRIGLLEGPVLALQFRLDLDEGVETLIYPQNPAQTANTPFYLGELVTTWRLPPIERKIKNDEKTVDFRGGGYPPRG